MYKFQRGFAAEVRCHASSLSLSVDVFIHAPVFINKAFCSSKCRTGAAGRIPNWNYYARAAKAKIYIGGGELRVGRRRGASKHFYNELAAAPTVEQHSVNYSAYYYN